MPSSPSLSSESSELSTERHRNLGTFHHTGWAWILCGFGCYSIQSYTVPFSSSLVYCVFFTTGSIPSTLSITRTCVSCGTGKNTTWPYYRAACSSITTPSSACRRSREWKWWRAPRSGSKRTTSLPRPMEIRRHVRTTNDVWDQTSHNDFLARVWGMTVAWCLSRWEPGVEVH